ncbi:MAG: hypothetical protein QOK24_2396 [Verrucomicrobiota bacterium]|jgi:hypothetical protein
MQRIQQLVVSVCCLFVMAGCFVPKQKRFVDVSARDFSPEAKVTAEGNILRIFVPEDLKELAVAEIRPEVIEGNIYLFTLYVSHARRDAEFVFDMSEKRFPRDWKNRLYWIEYNSIPSPFHPFASNRVNELHRRKVAVEEKN